MTSLHLLKPFLLAPALLLTLVVGGCTQDPPIPDAVATEPVATEPVNATARPYADYDQLAWSDEFDGAALDARKWKPEIKDVWYNDELQATTDARTNLTVDNGNLLITARKEAYNGRQYTSGRIITKGLKSFNFGRIDTRARLPKGKGMWPAIWMLGTNDSQATWPACGEIDIMELRGSQPRTSIATLHFGATVAQHQQQDKYFTLPTGDFSDGFHLFSVVRSQDQMRFFVDDSLFYTRNRADISPYPFNNPFYMILNVAVGGGFDGDPDANTVFPQAMLVDYVRYYKYKE